MLKKMKPPGWVLFAALAFAGLSPGEALAQQRDPAAAQALFDQARALIKQGHYAEACPKLVESNRLDPGIGTQFHLADCYEKSGQIATAWATFLDVASLARSTNQPDREKAATKRADQLEARLPRLTLNVAEASKAPGLELHRDGVLLGSAQWGVPMPVDPGAHELTVSAPGYKPLKQELKLEEGKALAFDVPTLEKDNAVSVAPTPAAAPEEPAPAPVAPAPVERPRKRKPAPPEAKSNVDALPLVLAAVGVVGLGVGSGFALKAMSTNKQSKTDCDAINMNSCGSTGLSQRSDAITQGNIASIGFIAGGALLTAAVIVWRVEAGSSSKTASTSLSPIRASASLRPGAAALYVQGGF